MRVNDDATGWEMP